MDRGKCLPLTQVKLASRIIFPKNESLGMSLNCSPRWKRKQYSDSLEEFSPFPSCWNLSYHRVVSEMLSKSPGSATGKEAILRAEVRSTLTLYYGCWWENSRKSQSSHSPDSPWWTVAFPFLRYNTAWAYLLLTPSHLQLGNWVS